MAKFNLFSAENLLMSVCGHLVLCAIMITSFVVVLNRAQLVAPDRIQIMEIDLNDVVVSGDETKLYNVGQVAEPEPKVQDVVPEQNESQPVKDSEPVEEPEEIIAPTLVEEKKVEEQPEKIKEEPEKKRI